MRIRKTKQSFYFPADLLKELQQEAARQNRSLSWLIQRAWCIARRELEQLPSHEEPLHIVD